jgi:NADH dehydrogenase (ubiquinone) Fe-S protein 2
MLRASLASLPARRAFATAAARRALHPLDRPSNAARTQGAKAALEHHTVEDLHHMSALEALAETGTRKDSTMRHFTGM